VNFDFLTEDERKQEIFLLLNWLGEKSVAGDEGSTIVNRFWHQPAN
jgi:hypothetical protein